MAEVNIGSGGIKISLGGTERKGGFQLKPPEKVTPPIEGRRPVNIAGMREQKGKMPLQRRFDQPHAKPQTAEHEDYRKSTHKANNIREELSA